ncbi:MAG: Mitochondrial inner membrane protein oxa1 [Cirrosporium novae-zelandiae]|nr:MAG: Mitochondrial inner membrane protein oxa1 [Cirrosporium novae-zelandiae]
MMMPSRGLRLPGHAVKNLSRRLYTPLAPSRKFSAFSVRNSLIQARPAASSSFLFASRRPQPNYSHLIPSVIVSSVRYKSTLPVSTPSDLSAPLNPDPNFVLPPEIPQSIQEIDLHTLDVLPSDQIGHLHSLGLTYGWGPTNLVEWFIENTHVYFGLPWWGSFVLASVLVRIIVFPLLIKQTDMNARMSHIKPLLDPLQVESLNAMSRRDTIGMAKSREEMNAIRQEAGIKNINAFLPAMVQIPLAYGIFRLSNAMAHLPVPDLLYGGFGWFMDLTVKDPFYVLPAIAAAGSYLALKFSMQHSGTNMPGKTKQLLQVVFPGFLFIVSFWQPAAVQLAFVSGSLITAIQSAFLSNHDVRRWLGIFPSYEQPKPVTKKENKGLVDELKDTMKETMVKYGLNKKATSKGPGRRGEKELESAKTYEEKRQKEIQEEIAARRRAKKNRKN